MYSEPKQSLSFSTLIVVVRTDQKKEKTFPYIWSVCRCKFCVYCHEGKCALKRCCCMKERVKAKSCTFTEVLQDCFANVKYLSGNAYLYYCAACDLQYGSSHTDMRDLSNEEVVDSDVFRMICYTFAISVYGINAIKIAEKRERDQRGRVKKNE